MALVLADRVRDTTTTTGTGTVTLSGTAPTGYQNFSVVGNGNTTYYTINADSQWEVGIGTYSSTGPTLSRNTVLASSNGGALVNFAAGIKDVFITYPAEKAVTDDYGIALAATTATNIAGGAAGSIPYQTAANTTALLAAGTGVLIGGTTPSYTMSPSLTQVTVAADPTTNLQVATKQYVDTIAASGVTYHTPVKYEAPTPLTATYNNGSSGVGATLTNAGTLAAFAPDGVVASVNDRILIYTQADPVQNGVYTVTTVGSGSVAWVLTRATDANTYGLKSPNALGEGDAFFVTSGNTGAGETYVCNTSGTITFGTTPITFVQVSSAQVYSAGTGLTLTGTVFSLTAPVATTLGGTGLTSFTSGGAVYATSSSTLTTGTLPATSGGTGLSSYTAGDLLYATSSTTVGTLADVATGNALLSGGVGADPAWGKVGLTTHVTGTLPVANGGTGATSLTGYLVGNGTSAFTATATIPTSALSGTISLTTQVSGTLGAGNGGTGLSSYTVGDLLYASGTTTLASLPDVATGNALISGGVSNAPLWGKIGLTTHVSGTLPVSNGGSGATTLTGYLKGNGTSAFTASATIPAGDITGAALTKADDTNVTLTLGGSPSTALLAATSITAGWTGQLAVSRGGTGNSTLASGYLLKGNGVSPTSASVIYDDGTNVGIGNSAIPYVTANRTVFAVNGTSSALIGLQSAGANRGYLYADGSILALEAESPCALKFNAIGAQPMTFFTNNTERLSINSSGNVIANVDVRAPIFYDSNNTGFYVDPASGTNLNGPFVTTGGPAMTAGWNRTAMLGATFPVLVFNSANTKYSGIGVDYTTAAAGMYFWVNGSSADLTGTGSLALGIDTGNFVTAFGSFRAPIFYDSNNTAFYTDPASTSVMNTVNLSRINMANSNSVYADGDGNAGWRFGGTGYVYFNQASPSYFETSVIARSGVRNDSAALLTLQGGTSGGTQINTDTRSPIYYDSNNTAFYVDPASTSVLNALTLASGSVLGSEAIFNNMNQTHTTYGDANNVGFGFRYLQSGSNYPGIPGATQYYGMTLGLGSDYAFSSFASQFYWPRSSLGGLPYPSVRFRESGTWGSWSKIYAGWADAPSGATFAATGDFRAPIFYDSNDTNYYLDPASTGTALRVRGGAAFGPNPTWGALLRVGSDGWVGDYASVAVTNGNLHIDSQPGYDLYLNWYVARPVWSEGGAYFPIYYDRNNTGFYVDPASGSRLGGQVTFNGGTNIASNGDVYARRDSGSTGVYYFATGSDRYLYFDGSQYIFGGSYSVSSNRFVTGGDMRAPIFYDIDNTGFYTDPASTSVLNGLTVSGTISGSVNGSAAFVAGTNLGKTGPQGFFTTSSWTAANWANLAIGGGGMTIFNTPGQPAGNNYGFFIKTGNRDAGNGWGGIWQDYNGGSLWYGATVDGSVFATWYKTVAYGVNSSGTLYATDFYDNNNTAFYVDPSGTSFLNTVSLGAQTWRADVTWNNAVNVNISGESSFDMYSGGTFHVWDITAGNFAIRANAGGQTVIGQAGSRGLSVIGDLTATGNVTAYSDARLKKDVETIDGALDLVSKMRGVRYTRIDTEKHNVGVIAQEMLEVVPEVVQQGVGDDDTLSVAYGNLVGVLIEAIKELRAEVAELKATTPTITFKGN